jgi:hypothetical protein
MKTIIRFIYKSYHADSPIDLPQATTSLMHKRIIVMEYAAGIMQFTKLLLEDIFDESTEELRDNAYSTIIEPMVTKARPMMNCQPHAKFIALVKAIKRQDVDLYIRCPDGTESAIGCSQSERVISRKEFIVAALSNGPLMVVARVHVGTNT